MEHLQDPAQLDLSTLPEEARAAQWQQGLARLGLAQVGASPISGTLHCLAAHEGLRLTRLMAPAQCLRPLSRHAPDSPYLLVLTLRSRGHLSSAGREQHFAQNDLSALEGHGDWRLHWGSDVKAILLELPRAPLAARLGHQCPRLPTVLAGSVASDMLRATLGVLGEQIDSLSPAELGVSENALMELAGNALLRAALPVDGTLSPVQGAHFHRVTTAIAAGLSDVDLSLGAVADKVGLSVRYVQRLFELSGESFSARLRRERLERSRANLLDAGQASVSIAQIAHRHGFASASHFSRAFRAAYGVAPRDLRETSRAATQPYGFRGHPGVTPPPGATVPPPASADRSPDATQVPPPPPLPDADFFLPAHAGTVHWGHISRQLPPVLFVPSDSVVRIETLTQHGGDDPARFILGDTGAESVFRWTQEGKAVDRRGAGPMNASIFGRGAGEGFGVHICTGPIHVIGARPGDVLEIEILDIVPRPCANPAHAGKAFGSNASAWWGYQYGDPLPGSRRHETVTVFEVDLARPDTARAIYQFDWQPQTDPFGVVHETMDYPGVLVDHTQIRHRRALEGIEIPARPHFGFLGVAPREADIVDSIPPGYFGGNIDNWRAGPGARVYLPVAVEGALLSIGDGHFSQGDGEINGTGLEMSLTGTVRIRLHRQEDTRMAQIRGLSAPLIETPQAWVIQSFSFENHLRDLGRSAQTEVYTRSTVDLALRNAFRQARRFVMEVYGLSEDEAHALLSVAGDFAVTQVADGNFGVHAVLRRSLFPEGAARP